MVLAIRALADWLIYFQQKFYSVLILMHLIVFFVVVVVFASIHNASYLTVTSPIHKLWAWVMKY